MTMQVRGAATASRNRGRKVKDERRVRLCGKRRLWFMGTLTLRAAAEGKAGDLLQTGAAHQILRKRSFFIERIINRIHHILTKMSHYYAGQREVCALKTPLTYTVTRSHCWRQMHTHKAQRQPIHSFCPNRLHAFSQARSCRATIRNQRMKLWMQKVNMEPSLKEAAK